MAQTNRERPFRFYDNREKYLLFATTCSEKQKTAERVGQEFAHLNPKPPALRVFQAGSGEGTLLNCVLRHLHYRWPNVPFLVVVKENNPEFIRLTLRNLADRFSEHPRLVLAFTDLRYGEASWQALVSGAAQDRLKSREVALDGASSQGFDQQINRVMTFVSEAWHRVEGHPAAASAETGASVLMLYRRDQRFALAGVIPKPGETTLAYDLVIASQPYRSRLSAEAKVRMLLAPLAGALAPGGRMLTVQSTGRDPGREIISAVWPKAAPFPTPRQKLLKRLRAELATAQPDLDFIDPPAEGAEFDYRLQLNPDEVGNAIGTSTLLAAWNAATYVAQIEDQRLTEAMCHEGYLAATRVVLQKHSGLWFNNECFVVARRSAP